MNNQMIGKCKSCGQDYCMECSDFEGWEDFCSPLCRDEFRTEGDAGPKEAKRREPGAGRTYNLTPECAQAMREREDTE